MDSMINPPEQLELASLDLSTTSNSDFIVCALSLMDCEEYVAPGCLRSRWGKKEVANAQSVTWDRCEDAKREDVVRTVLCEDVDVNLRLRPACGVRAA